MSGTDGTAACGGWREAIERGRTRGYDELQPCSGCSGGERWVQHAIRKKDGRYQTYFFAVDAGRIEIAEDYAEEEQAEFEEWEDALAHLRARGADLSRFAPFKGQKPF